MTLRGLFESSLRALAAAIAALLTVSPAASQAPAPSPWVLSQNPAYPWKGTPRADIPDHRNGAVEQGRAVFGDPRWAARAMAIELRDFHRGAGARTARDYAARLGAACRAFGGLACEDPRIAPALASLFSASLTDDLDLFDARSLPTARLRPALAALALAMTGLSPDAGMLDVAVGAVADDDLDQGEGGFRAWLAGDPARREAVRRLEDGLAQAGVFGVTPTYQLLRTGSDWRGCGAPFEVPPPEAQAAIVPTLALVRARIQPALGAVEAKSAYRGPWFNVCAGGAERSAHREFSAVDLTPLTPMTRSQLMARLCPIYAASGADDRMGLGFYAGVRFHVDTQRHRSWASENGRAYAPCAADGGVNPPLPALPRLPLPPAPPSR